LCDDAYGRHAEGGIAGEDLVGRLKSVSMRQCERYSW
jgi:hypothetical protein